MLQISNIIKYKKTKNKKIIPIYSQQTSDYDNKYKLILGHLIMFQPQ